MAIRWSPWLLSLIVLAASPLLLGCEQASDGRAAAKMHVVTPPAPPQLPAGPRGGIASSDLLGLERVAIPPANVAYSRPGIDFDRYTAFMIEPVLFDEPGVLARLDIDPEELRRMQDSALSGFTRVLRRYYDVVEKPGPEVLTLRLHLVDLVPIPNSASPDWDDKLMPAFYIGRAEGQVEVRDSTTGEILAAVFDSRTPRRITSGRFYRVHRWGHLKFVFREFALQFRGRYDMMRHRPEAS